MENAIVNKEDHVSSLDAFLGNEENRKAAEQQAVKLWTIMTKDTRVEDSDSVTFNETQVVKATNLSHSKANNLFNLLHAFGLLEWTDVKKREFKIHFCKSCMHSAIRNDVIEVAKSINADILRYKKSIEGDMKLTDDQRKEALSKLKSDIVASLDL